MPVNKNATLRYQILDRCFSDLKRKYEIEDLLREVNDALDDMYGTKVSLRQIRDDIKYMRDRFAYNAPIMAYPYDGKRCYYRYEDPYFSIFNNKLSVEEVTTLRTTIEMLARYRGMQKNAWLEEVISNLEFRFGIKANAENIVSFEQNEKLKGLEFLGELIESAVNHQPLKFFYRTYSGKEISTIFHPYHLKQFNSRWFLFGLEENEELGKCITNKALDRIVYFSRANNVAFIPNKDINFFEYFNDVVGVSIPSDDVMLEDVYLKFDEDRFPYITSKPIHHTQETISESDRIVRIRVRPNKELISRIFSFCPQVEVIKPAWFRLKIEEMLRCNLKKYTSMQIDCTEQS